MGKCLCVEDVARKPLVYLADMSWINNSHSGYSTFESFDRLKVSKVFNYNCDMSEFVNLTK